MNRFRRPPRALCKARLDNIALVPASLLPQKARYQALANQLPAGDILVVLPAAPSPERQVLTKTAALFEAKGRHVTALGSDDLNPQQL
ncbi:MAG TPA: hypothetical protein VKQ30_02715 [Ktedonobacterales bacterium]|nr:hypothetical protein [Ktedonobacterales bacterium]